jgi:hypothetical protein
MAVHQRHAEPLLLRPRGIITRLLAVLENLLLALPPRRLLRALVFLLELAPDALLLAAVLLALLGAREPLGPLGLAVELLELLGGEDAGGRVRRGSVAGRGGRGAGGRGAGGDGGVVRDEGKGALLGVHGRRAQSSVGPHLAGGGCRVSGRQDRRANIDDAVG